MTYSLSGSHSISLLPVLTFIPEKVLMRQGDSVPMNTKATSCLNEIIVCLVLTNILSLMLECR